MKNIKPFLLIFFILFCTITGHSQAQRQNNYIVNPYLYLPTAAGQGTSGQLFLGVRKQWLGIDGSPTSSVLAYDQSLMKNLGMGGQFKYDQMGPLTDFSLSVTANYKLDLASAGKKQYFNFALSGGVAYSTFDISDVTDPDDPALSTLPENETGGIIKLGISYSNESFQGFLALPNMLGTDLLFSEESSSGPLNYWLIGAKYNLPVNQKIAIEPQVLYHGFNDYENKFEGICTFKYEQKVWVGASYRQSLGLGVLLGFAVSNDLMISYAFEEGGITSGNNISNTTHEIGVSLSL